MVALVTPDLNQSLKSLWPTGETILWAILLAFKTSDNFFAPAIPGASESAQIVTF